MALFAVFVVLWGICHLSSLAAVVKLIMGIFTPVIAGGCIAFILNIPLRFFERLWIKWFTPRVRWLRRTVCILLTLLLFSGAIVLLMVIVLPQIWNTLEGIIGNVPAYIEKMKGWYASLSAFLGRFSVDLPALSISSEEIMAKLGAIISDNSHHIIDTSVGIATSLFSGVFDTVVAIVIAIYVLAQKERLSVQAKKLLYSIFSEKNTERLLAFARLSEKTFSGFVAGQLTEAIIIAVLCFIGMKIFRIPYAPLISVTVGVTALIPIFGAFIGTGIGAFLILFDSPMKAIIFVIFIIVLQQFEGNVIYPRVVGSQVGLPGLWVLVAVTVGAEFGIFGMLISVPVVSLLYAVTRQIVNARIKEKGLEAQFPESNGEKKAKKPKMKKKKKKKKKNEPEAAKDEADSSKETE